MPTVYYTDGTSKKYKYYNELMKDPYLKINNDVIESLESGGYYYTSCLGISSQDCLKTENVLEKVKLEQITQRIIQTNSINICGISEVINCRTGYDIMCFPIIDKSIISKLEDMFPNIKKIVLSNNNLDRDDINFLKFKKCEVIKLNKNEFSSLSPDFCYLNNLRILKIEGKYINCPPYRNENEFIIPNYINKLKNLEILNLSNNNIKKIPPEIGELTKLKKLIMTHTDIKILPKEIGNLSNLEVMNFSVSSLIELPKEIEKLKKLKELLLEGSEYKISKEIGMLENLEKLKVNSICVDTDKVTFWKGCGAVFSDLPIEIWNTNISEISITRFCSRYRDTDIFNNPDYFCLEMFKSKKNIKIIEDDGWRQSIFNIIHNNNNIIIKSINQIDDEEKENIFTFKNNKLYKIVNNDFQLIEIKSKEQELLLNAVNKIYKYDIKLDNNEDNNFTIIICKIDKIEKSWKKSKLYISSLEEKRKNNKKYEQSKKDLFDLKVDKPPQIHLNEDNNEIEFDDGRHRFSVLRDYKFTRMPFIVNSNEKDEIIKLFS